MATRARSPKELSIRDNLPDRDLENGGLDLLAFEHDSDLLSFQLKCTLRPTTFVTST